VSDARRCLARIVFSTGALLATGSIAAPTGVLAVVETAALTVGPVVQEGTELRGKVTRVDGQTVWIAMESEMWPRPGDPVKLQQTVSGILMTMGGEWTVAEVTAEFVRAEPRPDSRGDPARDYVAVIQSANPQPRPAATMGTGGPGTGGGGGGTGGGTGNHPIDLDEASALYDSLVGAISTEPTREEIRAQADAGDPWAQTQMGVYYFNGDGVTRSYDEAMRWYRLAAGQGWGNAMVNLGAMYGNGTGMAQDDQEAVAWYRRAADVGLARGQRMLGYMYQTGRGVTENTAEAVRLYGLAAAQDYADAHNDLGVMYEQGWGVQPDQAQAVTWFRSAANLGNDWGYLNLAEHYERGQGVPADRNLAIQNYQAAARLGNTKAQDWLRNQGLSW